VKPKDEKWAITPKAGDKAGKPFEVGAKDAKDSEKKDKSGERTEEQKKADLNRGIAEAQKLLEDQNLSSDQVKQKLPAIKSTYKITILELVIDAKNETKETDHIHGEIHSKPVKADSSKVDKKEKTAEEAHNEVMAKMSSDNKLVLKGNGSYTAGHAGRGFSTATRDAVDDIGYATGDHSFPDIKDPGTKPGANPETKWGKLGKGNWIPDHQPPDTLVGGGAVITIRFYPHSNSSRVKQGGAVRVYKMWMKEVRKRDNSNWAEGVKSEWFW